MITQKASTVGQSSATPHSNTGSNRREPNANGIECGIDYFVCTGKADIEELSRAVWSVFGTNFDWAGAKPGTRGRYYDTILKSAQGIELAFLTPKDNGTNSTYRLSIPGKPLNHVHLSEFRKLGRYLLAHSARCSRLDWRIDDYCRVLSLDSIASQCENRGVAGTRQWRDIKSTRGTKAQQGRTIYFGSPQSEKLVRIYDKGVESNGEVDSIRYEVQWRGAYAQSVFETLVQGTDEAGNAQKVSNLAVGAIDFIDRTSEVRSRCPRAQFWEDFVSRVGVSAKLSVRRLQKLITEKIHWVEYQVSGTLALITKAKGFDETLNWIERLIRDKCAKFTTAQQAYLDSWRDRLKVELGTFDDFMVVSSWDKI